MAGRGTILADRKKFCRRYTVIFVLYVSCRGLIDWRCPRPKGNIIDRPVKETRVISIRPWWQINERKIDLFSSIGFSSTFFSFSFYYLSIFHKYSIRFFSKFCSMNDISSRVMCRPSASLMRSLHLKSAKSKKQTMNRSLPLSSSRAIILAECKNVRHREGTRDQVGIPWFSLSLFRSLLEVERLEMVPGVSCSFIPRKHLCADPIETPTRDEPTLNRPLTVCHRMHCKDFTSHFHACCEFSLFG